MIRLKMMISHHLMTQLKKKKSIPTEWRKSIDNVQKLFVRLIIIKFLNIKQSNIVL